MSPSSDVKEMTGFKGGLNEGVWYVSDSVNGNGQDFVLKLVRCHRVATNIPTEAENLVRLSHEQPQIMSDPTVSFPVKVFKCLAPGQDHRHDLIVMRKMGGERLAEFIARKWDQKQMPALLDMLRKLGSVLAAFHRRYGNAQHGDLQPSNIFYNEENGELTFIDIGGIGVPTMETDREHFAKAMRILSNSYGPELWGDGKKFFDEGYAEGFAQR